MYLGFLAFWVGTWSKNGSTVPGSSMGKPWEPQQGSCAKLQKLSPPTWASMELIAINPRFESFSKPATLYKIKQSCKTNKIDMNSFHMCMSHAFAINQPINHSETVGTVAMPGFGLALAMGRDGWPGLRKCLDLHRALKAGCVRCICVCSWKS